ncbi:MAG: hypothetical protein WA939_22050 [Nodosilinea sp.]
MAKNQSPVLGPNGQPLPSSSSRPALDDKAKGVIGEISTGYYLWWWCITHPVKLLLYSIGGVGALATAILVLNFGISLAVGDGPSVIRPIRRADVGDWGDRAGRNTRDFLEQRRLPAAPQE